MSTRHALGPYAARLGSDPVHHDFDKLWRDALQRYKDETGKDLLGHPIAKAFPSRPGSADEVIKLFEKQNESFKTFRTHGQKILDALRPVVDIVLLVLDVGANVASNTVPGATAIFGAIGMPLKAAKGVSGLYDAIETLLHKVKHSLDRIKIHLSPSTPPSPALFSILVDTLVQVFTILAIVTKRCDMAVQSDSKFGKVTRVLSRRLKDYLAVVVNNTDVTDALKRLEELTNAELLATAAHTNAIARCLQAKVADVYNSTVIDDLRLWLRPPNPQPVNYEMKRQAGSCQWFFDGEFEDWKMRKDGVYWVYGRAGSGKSVLCSSIIDTLQEDTTLLLAYFYFDFNDLEKQDCRGFVASLVFQIGISFEKGITHLRRERRSFDFPVYERLVSILSSLLSLSGRTIIIIDALDECPEPARDSGLLSFLEHLHTLQTRLDIDLRVLVASRLEPDIRDRMPALATHTLNFHDAVRHREDISDYISDQLFDRGSRLYSGWSDGVKEQARQVLIERSNGMFLWVVLQLRHLKHCAPGDIERALNELPSDLNGTYERILKDFHAPNVSIDRARHVFECIAFAKRPLSLTEVVEILSMNFDSSAELAITLNSELAHGEDLESFVLQKCPGLLAITGVSSNDDGVNQIVQFIHLLVKEYLVSDDPTRSTSPARLYYINDYDANLTLARICLSALDIKGSLLRFRIRGSILGWPRIFSEREGSLRNSQVFPRRRFAIVYPLDAYAIS
ncbi:hypothetical protein PENSPDRAFT_298261 [Peniophora sp. CONT]|nr:hypothetical protein PENSPDRAFT_298261 [Peniophora sp. CONT]